MGDERLALEAKRGNEVAFEVIYDRHHGGLLSFCRHMLRSREDAEDALQQTFASAFRALRGTEQPIQLKPWLYTIARNRCISMLRGRRDHPVEEVGSRSSMAGLSEEVERRAELRGLLSDLEHLPERQKSALVLSEVGDLDHAHIAQVLACETTHVKSLVFQARSALIANRDARDIPCTEIREQLATANAGELRRGALRRHVRQCQGCAEFREEVRCQRRMLALALPVVPSLGLKESALAAAGIGGGGAAGGGGLIAALSASGVAKVAAVGVIASGAAGGLSAADPNLISRAQAAVERGANGVQGVSSNPSGGSRGEKAGAEKVSGSFHSDAAQRTARGNSRLDEKAGRGAASRGAPRPGKGGAQADGATQGGRGGQGDDGRSDDGGRLGRGSSGKAHAYGRKADAPDSTGHGRRGGGRREARRQAAKVLAGRRTWLGPTGAQGAARASRLRESGRARAAGRRRLSPSSR